MVCMLSLASLFFVRILPPPSSPPFPYTTLFRSLTACGASNTGGEPAGGGDDDTNAGGQDWSQCTPGDGSEDVADRSEEHTSELQSRGHLVCRLLLGKKKN